MKSDHKQVGVTSQAVRVHGKGSEEIFDEEASCSFP